MVETESLIRMISSLGIEVVDGVTEKMSNDMGRILYEEWGDKDIIIIGQDNVPSIGIIKEMVNCPFDLCVNPCISYPASTALDRPMLNQISKSGRMYEVYETPRIIHYGGTGVCKISLDIQIKKPLNNGDFGFPAFDSALKDRGFVDWHGHYPLHKHSKVDIKNRHWGL